MQKLKIKALCLLFTLSSLFFYSCKTKTATAPIPSKAAALQVNRPLSTLNIPISLSIGELETSLNRQIQKTLYNDDSYENNNNDNLILKITKLDDFKLSAISDRVTIVAPLEIYVEGRIKKDFFSLFDQDYGISKSKNAVFRINVIINTKLSLNQDWDLITKSETSFQWREQPYLELGPIKIPIGSIIETVVNNQISNINRKLDAEITKNIKVKPIAQQYWNQLQNPIVISERYQTYLKITPEFISISSISSDGVKLYINLAFRSDINFVSGYKPEPADLKPLPKLQQQTRADSTFNLYFGAGISYAHATELAKKEFLGKTLKFDNGMQEVTINDLNFFNNGNKLGMMLNINGVFRNGIFKKKFKGTIYALGTPYYNDSSQTLSVKDFDFDVKTKDVLIGTAEWLMKGSLKKLIEEKLNYPMKEQIDNAVATADNALNNAKIPNIKLKGKVESITPFGITLTEESIQVVIQSKGNLKVFLNNY